MRMSIYDHLTDDDDGEPAVRCTACNDTGRCPAGVFDRCMVCDETAPLGPEKSPEVTRPGGPKALMAR